MSFSTFLFFWWDGQNSDSILGSVLKDELLFNNFPAHPHWSHCDDSFVCILLQQQVRYVIQPQTPEDVIATQATHRRSQSSR